MSRATPPNEVPASPEANWARVDAVFSALLDLPPDLREAALPDHCGGDVRLATAVRRLLEAERRSADAFDAAVTSIQRLAENALEPDDHKPSPADSLEHIGPWRLVDRLGSGGMSVVWKAERNDGQYQQTAAIKLLRRWIETDETVQRFREERRILARLEHPNLARLLDGGVIGEGWPYFVMEYVDGLPITDYCDLHRLDIEARLELFLQVLEVVQYAHRRLVVHRDLKPSNILVTKEGRVKLLDFGIAKVLDREALSATESELTELGGRPMTPAYASPEQFSGDAITTASDVYALGVLLYQLLTGRAPYRVPADHPMRLREAVLREIPVHPSARVLETGEDGQCEALANKRATGPARLARQLRGDLDVICQVALRKEPDQRYTTVEQLGADIERHRRRLPVMARAGNWRYLAARFVRRNAWAVAAGILIPVATLVGIALHVERLGTERDRAEAAAVQAEREAIKARQVTDYVVSLFRAADPAQAAGREVTAVELVERGIEQVDALSDDPGLQAEMFRVLGQVSQALGQYPRAADLLRNSLSAIEAAPPSATLDRAAVLTDLGFIEFQLGRLDESERHSREALAALPPDEALRRAPILTNLGIVHIITSRYTEAQTLLGEAIAAHEAGEPGSAAHATTLNALGTLLSREARHAEAIAMLESAVDMRRVLFGEVHPATSVALGNLGIAVLEAGDPAGGEAYLLQALAIDEQVLGYDHPSVAVLLGQLGGARRGLDDPAGSIEYLVRALDILQQHEGEEGSSPSIAVVLSGLGTAHLRLGNLDQADAYLQRAIEIEERVLGPDSRELAIDLVSMGSVRLGQGRLPEAQALARRGLEILTKLLAEDNPLVINAREVLAEILQRSDQAGEGVVAEGG